MSLVHYLHHTLLIAETVGCYPTRYGFPTQYYSYNNLDFDIAQGGCSTASRRCVKFLLSQNLIDLNMFSRI